MKVLKGLTFSLVLCLCAAAPLWAQTQLEMNQAAHARYEAADKELNRVWNQLIPKLSPEVKDKLVEAQLRWLKFRDGEAEAWDAKYKGGSIRPLMRSESLTESTKLRTKQLKIWLEESSR